MVARQGVWKGTGHIAPSQTQRACHWVQAELGSTAVLSPLRSWPLPKWQEFLSKLLLRF